MFEKIKNKKKRLDLPGSFLERVTQHTSHSPTISLPRRKREKVLMAISSHPSLTFFDDVHVHGQRECDRLH